MGKKKSGHRIYIFDRGEIKYLHKIKHFHYIDSITWIVSRNSLFIDSTNGTFGFVGAPQQRPYLVSFYDDDIVLGLHAA